MRDPGARGRWTLALGLIALVALPTVLALPLAGAIQLDLSPSRLLIHGDADEQFRLELEEEFQSTWNPIVLVFESDAAILSPERLRALHALGESIEEMDLVRRVVHPANVEVAIPRGDEIEVRELLYPPPEGTELALRSDTAVQHRLLRRRVVSGDARLATLVVETEDLDAEQSHELVARVRKRTEELLPPGVRVSAVGFPVIHTDYTDLLSESRARLLPVVLGLIVLMLVWAFRSPVGVGAPLLCIAVAVVWTLALMSALGLPITLLGSLIPIVTLLITVSCSIHLLAGFGEARAGGADRREAVRVMVRRAGVACLLATLTTAVGFSSLASARINIIREFGVSAALGVLCAFGASVLLLSGLLLVARRPPRPPASTGRLERGLTWLVGRIVQRPRPVLVAAAILVLVFGLLALRVRNDEFIAGEVDSGHPLARALALADRELAGVAGFVVSIRSRNGDLLTPATLERIAALQAHLESLPDVRHTLSFVDYLGDMNRVFHGGDEAFERPPDSRELAAQYLLLLDGGDDSELPRLLSHDRAWAVVEVGVTDIGSRGQLTLHEEVRQHLARHPFGGAIETRLGGRGVVYPKAAVQTVDDLMLSFGIAFVVIFGVLVAMLRSLRIAAIAMIPNLIPALVCLGYMGAFGVTLRTGTAVCFAAVLGIAVDDTIHFLLRYRRELRHAGDVRGACERAVQTVGRPIVLTSLALVLGFLVYTASPFDTQRQLGALVSLALSAAVVADIVLLPALLAGLEPSRAQPVA